MAGNEAGQAGPAFPKPTLAGCDPLAVLYVLHAHTQDDLLQDLLWYKVSLTGW